MRHFALISGTDGGGIDFSGLPHFSLYFRLFDLKSELFYETDERKIQEDCKILARKLCAGKQARPLVPGYVCSDDACLRLVGYPGSLIRTDHPRGR